MKALPLSWERRVVKEVDFVGLGGDGGQGRNDIWSFAFGNGSAKVVIRGSEGVDCGVLMLAL